jgi:hypothetical protein
MASSCGRALDSKQIHEQLHDDSDPFSESSQDSNIDIFDRIDPDGVSGCGGGGGYNDEDHDNEDWDLWDENNHDFYMIPFCASPAFFFSGVGLTSPGTAATSGLLYSPR